MRTFLGMVCGIGLVLFVMSVWRGPTAWLFTRIPPATHPDCRPRFKVWHDGIGQDVESFPEVPDVVRVPGRGVASIEDSPQGDLAAA